MMNFVLYTKLLPFSDDLIRRKSPFSSHSVVLSLSFQLLFCGIYALTEVCCFWEAILRLHRWSKLWNFSVWQNPKISWTGTVCFRAQLEPYLYVCISLERPCLNPFSQFTSFFFHNFFYYASGIWEKKGTPKRWDYPSVCCSPALGILEFLGTCWLKRKILRVFLG